MAIAEVEPVGKEVVERRSEFRFPVMIPVEYVKPDEPGISSYSSDLGKNGVFISADDLLEVGSKVGVRLMIRIDREFSKVFQTEGTVAWRRMQPFRSTSNGMGVRFTNPLPEALLLHALTADVRRLIKESEAKGTLERRLDKLESELEELRSSAALGSSVGKILFELANPILILSGKLELINRKMHVHERMIREHDGSNNDELKRTVTEFEYCCKEVDDMLQEYKSLSALAHIGGDDKETLERKLERYH